MASCVIPGCKNNKKNCIKSFFRLPKDKELERAWIVSIKREDKLPKEVWVCEDHFETECFDVSADLKRKFLKPGARRLPRKLVHGSVPSIFPSKPLPKKRTLPQKLEQIRLINALAPQYHSPVDETSEHKEEEPTTKSVYTQTEISELYHISTKAKVIKKKDSCVQVDTLSMYVYEKGASDIEDFCIQPPDHIAQTTKKRRRSKVVEADQKIHNHEGKKVYAKNFKRSILWSSKQQ